MAVVETSRVKQWLAAIKAEKARRLSEGVSPDDRRYNIYAAMTFVLLMGFVGLPQWWMTTRVYRAPLPYWDIANLKDATLVLPVSVSLVAGDKSTEKILREDNVAEEIKSLISKGSSSSRIKVALELTERMCSDAEKTILMSEFDSIEQLENDLYLASVGSRGKKVHSQDIKGDGLEIFILNRPRESYFQVQFGTTGRVFIIGDFVGDTRVELAETLARLVLKGYLRMDELVETVARHTRDENKPMPDITKGKLSVGILNPKLTLEMHVVDPEPIQCPQRFSIDHIVGDSTIKQFLESIRGVTEVSVKSQTLYNVEFRHEPIKDIKNPQYWYLDPTSLQHIINPIETYLGTDVTTEPVYHMLLYIVPPAVSPLFVPSPENSRWVEASSAKKAKNRMRPQRGPRFISAGSAPYNSFVVSGWGSVSVLNANRTCHNGKNLIIDGASLKDVKKALVANLRKFFGLQLPKGFDRVPSAALADWEVQSLRYRALVEYTFSSIRTLNSLTKLLGEITNIVINDEIGAEIALAVTEMKSVLGATSDGVGGHWRVHSMLKSATKAFEESEKAFFDPSLLSLLYFPDDQKYAVYIPLFLPIGVPVLGSVLFIWKHLDYIIDPDEISIKSFFSGLLNRVKGIFGRQKSKEE